VTPPFSGRVSEPVRQRRVYFLPSSHLVSLPIFFFDRSPHFFHDLSSLNSPFAQLTSIPLSFLVKTFQTSRRDLSPLLRCGAPIFFGCGKYSHSFPFLALNLAKFAPLSLILPRSHPFPMTVSLYSAVLFSVPQYIPPSSSFLPCFFP